MLSNRIPQDFTEKITEANQLYKEAFLSFLPESAANHLHNIQTEFSALCKDCIMESMAAPSKSNVQNSAQEKTRGTHKVKKVTIN